MPSNCAVYKCGHNSKRDKDRFSFFRFPALVKHQGEKTLLLSTERRQAWINNIGRDKEDLTIEKIEHTRVCSDHFISGKPAKLYDKANPDWAPTQKMGHEKLVLKVSDIDLSRHERAAERGKKRKQFEKEKAMQRAEKFARAEELATEEIRIAQREEEETCKCSQTDSIETDMVKCQTELTGENMKDLEDVTSLLAVTKKQLHSMQFNEDAFLNDNVKTRFYTGLPSFTILMHVLNLLTPYIKSGTRTSLSKFQQFILVLMRMKLDAPRKTLHIDLAFLLQLQAEYLKDGLM